MEKYSPRIEPLPRFDQYNNPQEASPWRHSSKVKIFTLSAGLFLSVGLLWTLFQPSLYRSDATVLMSAPAMIDESVIQANIQAVAIQRTILLGEDITAQLLSKLAHSESLHINSDYLDEALSVDAVPETNLITMSAQGADREILSGLVDTWIEVYTSTRAQDIEQRKNQTLLLVREELEGLTGKIEAARYALEVYRAENNIVSVKREENAVLSRLDGLNKALNNAVESEVKAKAYLDAVNESMKNGSLMLPSGDERTVLSLESELEQLRGEMIVMRRRYTPEYIRKQPALRAIPERIDKLEADLSMRVSEGRAEELANARQDYNASRRATRDLQQKLDEHREGVSRFNRIYATHEALVEDLASLEELSREMQARLVQVEVKQVDKYPQVTIIEPPGRPERIGPDYTLLLGGSLAGALGFGVLCVWLYGFLGHDKPQPAYVTLSGVPFYPNDVAGELSHSGQPVSGLPPADPRLLRGDPKPPDDNDVPRSETKEE